MQEKTVSEAIEYRRSVRKYDNTKTIETSVVKKCIEQATLAPNSSNMQLWEFYHITSKTTINKIAKLCFNQNTAQTANQLVVFVTRKDLYKKRAKANLAEVERIYGKNPPAKQSKREKRMRNYYGKTIPFLYASFFGFIGWFRYVIIVLTGIFRPVYRQVRNSDMRIVAHKSIALVAQNFMTSMASVGYDTCAMEGFDSLRVKRALNLPFRSEINMIISCGIRKEDGIYGERFRVPFEEVYKEI